MGSRSGLYHPIVASRIRAMERELSRDAPLQCAYADALWPAGAGRPPDLSALCCLLACAGLASIAVALASGGQPAGHACSVGVSRPVDSAVTADVAPAGASCGRLDR